MRLLILANDSGGLYDFRAEVIKQMIANGIEVYVSLPDEAKRIEIEHLGCTYVLTPFNRRGMNPINDMLLLQTYQKLLRQIKPVGVLLYTIKPNVYGGIACQMAQVSYISTITGLGTAFDNPGVLKKLVVLLYRLGLKKASAVMFQNSANQKVFEQLRIGRNYHLVSGSGVNLNYHSFENYPPRDSTVRILFVGRIMKDKGIYEYLEAAENVKKRHPEVQFDLIGGFDENLERVVDRAVSKEIINYLGVQNEMHTFYKDCWAVVMPSYHEGICNVCLEGAATGRPVLATNVPGCKETFDEGVSGVGFEAKSAQALINAIENFLSLSYEEKVAMGLAGRKKMEREFDRNQVVQAYMEEIQIIKGSKK